VNTTKTVEIRHDFTFSCIKNDQFVGVHVRNVQPAVGAIQALIIEADGRPRERHVGDKTQDFLFFARFREIAQRETDKEAERDDAQPKARGLLR